MSRIAGIAGGVLCALCLQVPTAEAAEEGFYFGVSGGQSEYKIDTADLVPRPAQAFSAGITPVLTSPGVAVGVPIAVLTRVVGAPAGVPFGALNPVLTPAAFTPFETTTFDRTDATWSLTAGYRINRYISAELSYIDLGEARLSNVATISSPLASFDLSLDQTIEIAGVSAAVLGTWPIAERWALHARGGYEFTDSESRLTLNGNDVFEIKESSDNFVIGLGVDFALTSHWSLRAEAERHLDIGGDVFAEDSDIDVYRLAVLYRL
jgi:hypothetical protein